MSAELLKCVVGKTCFWDSVAKLGHSTGRPEQAPWIYWQQLIWICSAEFTSANMVYSLEFVCVLQSWEREGSCYRDVSLQAAVSWYYSDNWICIFTQVEVTGGQLCIVHLNSRCRYRNLESQRWYLLWKEM